jgi:hypothetical protein
MAQRRHHYEHAFEEYLRARRIPYVAVDEARKALLPGPRAAAPQPADSLKSFDFVIYGQGANLLVEVKGRRVGRGITPGKVGSRATACGRLESWVTVEDIESLQQWEGLFGPEFQAAFVFVYWCDQQPPDALFQEVFEQRGRWYALRAVKVREYAAAMKVRSTRWRTMHVPSALFERISMPFAPPIPEAAGAAAANTLWYSPFELPAVETLVGGRAGAATRSSFS